MIPDYTTLLHFNKPTLFCLPVASGQFGGNWCSRKNGSLVQGFQEIHHFKESRLLRNNKDYISLESYSHENSKCMLTFLLGSDIIELSAVEFLPFW
jgi:hypothetical protein